MKDHVRAVRLVGRIHPLMPDQTPAQQAAQRWLDENPEEFEHWYPTSGDFAGQSFHGEGEDRSYSGIDYSEPRSVRHVTAPSGFPRELHYDENGMPWNEFGEWNTAPEEDDPYYSSRLGLADQLGASHIPSIGGVAKRDDYGVLHSITDPENSGTGKWHVDYSIYRGPETPPDDYESEHSTPEEAADQVRANIRHVQMDRRGWSKAPNYNDRYHRESTSEPGIGYTIHKTQDAEKPWRLTKLVGGNPVAHVDRERLMDADYDTNNDVPERTFWTMHREAVYRLAGSVSRQSDTVWR